MSGPESRFDVSGWHGPTVFPFLCALVLAGLIGAGATTLAAGQTDAPAPSDSTMTRVGQESYRANVATVTQKTSSLWDKWDNRRRRAPFKMGLGLLGAVVFVLALTKSRTVLRRIPTPVALAVATAVMMCFVGLTVQVLSGKVTPLATMVAIGFGVLGLVWLGRTLATRDRPSWSERLRADALVMVILAGVLGWTSFGYLHGGSFLQFHEFFHYYVGSKYFPENRYLRIYHCTVISENEDGFHVTKRRLRDLETNRSVLSDDFLPRSAECRDRYSEERWRAFQQDVRFFKSEMSAKGWAGMLEDKGYNATPLWTAIGHRLSNWNWEAFAPPPDRVFSNVVLQDLSPEEKQQRRDAFVEDREGFETRLAIFSMIDPLLYVGAFTLVYWAFGLEACALTVLLFGIGLPWDFRYTGGAFARIPWFFCATASVCLVKKGYQAWGGGMLAASAMLRLFPAALFGGVALTAAVRLVRHRTFTRAHRRLVLGALVGLAILVPASMTTGGPGIYSDFLTNTARHATTPLTNHAGLRALFSMDPDNLFRNIWDPTRIDPAEDWRSGRIQALEERKVYYWICVTLIFGLVWTASRKLTDWERLVAGTLVIVSLVDLTSYYFVFVLLWAPFASRRIRDTLIIVGTAVITQIPLLASRWTEEQNLAQSAIVIVFMCTMLGLVIADPDRKADPDLASDP